MDLFPRVMKEFINEQPHQSPLPPGVPLHSDFTPVLTMSRMCAHVLRSSLTPPLPIHLPLPLPLPPALVQQPIVLGREVVQVTHAAPREDHVAHLG